MEDFVFTDSLHLPILLIPPPDKNKQTCKIKTKSKSTFKLGYR